MFKILKFEKSQIQNIQWKKIRQIETQSLKKGTQYNLQNINVYKIWPRTRRY